MGCPLLLCIPIRVSHELCVQRRVDAVVVVGFVLVELIDVRDIGWGRWRRRWRQWRRRLAAAGGAHHGEGVGKATRYVLVEAE
jgi:hypothetical protein